MRPSRLAVLPLLLAAAPSTRSADTYPIRQFRPSHVGDVFALDVTTSRHRHAELTVKGQPPTAADDDRSVHLAGRCTVVAVDGRGAYTALSCRVDVLTATVAGRTSAVLPAGATVAVTQGPTGPAYRRADGPLADAAAGPLSLVLTAYSARGPTADELFPAGRPRALGESWPMDAARASDGSAAHVAGHATLAGLATLAGRPAVRVSRVVDADGPAPVPAEPAGLRTAHRNALTESTATVPLDPADAAADLVTRETVDHDLHGVTEAGAAFTEQTHVVTDTHAVRTPVPR